jgi:hypothetical protein
MDALRGATLGSGNPWADIGVCAALAAAYLAVGSLLLRIFLTAARAKATLALTA